MPRSEREIAEYMAYYSSTTDRRAALTALARVEKKTEAEIREICERYKKGKGAEQVKNRYSDELKRAVADDHDQGIKPSLIADKHGLTLAQVNSIITMTNKARRKGKTVLEPVVKSEQQKQLDAITAKHPEAYPNQIYDEHELEFEKHVEELAAKRDAFKPKPVPASDDFAVGRQSETFNDYEPEPAQSRDIKIVVKVPKGVRLWIRIEEEHEAGQKEGTDN